MSRSERGFVALLVGTTFVVSTAVAMLTFSALPDGLNVGERGSAIQFAEVVVPYASDLLLAAVVGFVVVATVERLRPALGADERLASLLRAASPLLGLGVLAVRYVDLPFHLPTVGPLSTEAVFAFVAAAVAVRRRDESFPWTTSLALALAFAYLAGWRAGADLSGPFMDAFVVVEERW